MTKVFSFLMFFGLVFNYSIHTQNSGRSENRKTMLYHLQQQFESLKQNPNKQDLNALWWAVFKKESTLELELGASLLGTISGIFGILFSQIANDFKSYTSFLFASTIITYLSYKSYNERYLQDFTLLKQEINQRLKTLSDTEQLS